jgi:predicted secreted protein
MIRGGALLGAALLAGAPAFAAQEEKPKDQVTFRVEAAREVPNDWVAATLGVEEESTDLPGLAARVNQRMAAALELAKQDQKLTVASGAYQTQPVYDKTRIARWRAIQDLTIETADVAALAEMAGKLQAQGLLLRHVAFSVAPDTRKRVDDELTVEALSVFRERAGLIARGLGRRGWNLVTLTLGDIGMPVPYVMEHRVAMKAAAADVAPSFESGRSTVKIEVNATIELE